MSETKSDLVVVGAILGAHGVRGDVRVKSFTADPEALFDYAPFLSEDGDELLVPLILMTWSVSMSLSAARRRSGRSKPCSIMAPGI